MNDLVPKLAKFCPNCGHKLADFGLSDKREIYVKMKALDDAMYKCHSCGQLFKYTPIEHWHSEFKVANDSKS